MDFKESLAKARKELGLTQKQLAFELKTSFASINRWENGKHIPNEMTLGVISAFFTSRGISFNFDITPKEKS